MRRFNLAPALFAALASGCADGPPPTYPASGSVTAGGKPAAGAVVTLIPADAAARPANAYPAATVGADGRYALSAPAGDYKLTLRWPAELPGKAKALAEAQGEGGDADRLKGRHADPAASPWAVTVVPGDNAIAPVSIPAR